MPAPSPVLSLIAALDRRGVIGRDNDMPWYLPSDLQFFKRVTLAKPLLLGRRTFESIGRPLPGRHCIVISSQPGYRAEGCELAASFERALVLAGDRLSGSGLGEIMIGGGARLYRQALPRAARLYLTHVDAEVDGDVCFPAFDETRWRVLWEQRQPADRRHPYRYRRVLLIRG